MIKQTNHSMKYEVSTIIGSQDIERKCSVTADGKTGQKQYAYPHHDTLHICIYQLFLIKTDFPNVRNTRFQVKGRQVRQSQKTKYGTVRSVHTPTKDRKYNQNT